MGCGFGEGQFFGQLMQLGYFKFLSLMEGKIMWPGIIIETDYSQSDQHTTANGKTYMGEDIMLCKLAVQEKVTCGRNCGSCRFRKD